MENFSAKRLFVNVLLLLISVFMVLSGVSRLISFLKASSIRVVNEKVTDYPVYKQMDGDVFFISVPVVASASGEVEKLFGNFSYVKKGEIIGRIKNSEYTVDILSPSEGLLLWGSMGSYYSRLEDFENGSSEGCNFELSNKNAEKGKVICSVVNNDNFYIRLPVRENSILLYCNGINVKGSVVYSGKKFSIYELNQYMKYFLTKNSYLVFTGSKNGIKLRSNVIVKRNGKQGIYIVSGNIIKFVPVTSYPLENGYNLATGNFNSNSVIVITTPRFVRNGEIFNE